MSSLRTLRLHADDNVVVAVDSLPPEAETAGVVTKARVPRGHKLAITSIGEGRPVIKYGQIIGFATSAINAGDHVHEHNIAMRDFDRDYEFATVPDTAAHVPDAERAIFDGFRRPDGRVGTRNYLGVLTSVNCSASVARFIAQAAQQSGLLDDFPNVDGVVSFVHGTGCGMASSGEGYEVFERTQWGYTSHPNLAGVLLVGLGCEVFQIHRLMEKYGIVEHDGFRQMTIQGEGGTRRTIDQGLGVIRDMLPLANTSRREPVPASEITLALQCGGSDGYSGITANPALGAAADRLVAHGGTAILAETPEIYGAEHLLTRRAASREVGEKLVERIRWWEAYTERNRCEINANPSPGNKAGGLTTILEKSLGAAAKGGTTSLRGVYEYAQKVDRKGFLFMDSPGYDPCSVTGQVASGANVVTFTTGRGSAFGFKPSPSIKLATNSETYRRMTDDMDINCGDVLDGVSIETKGQEIFDEILAVASGKRTKSEQLGYGDNEFVPWQIGAVM